MPFDRRLSKVNECEVNSEDDDHSIQFVTQYTVCESTLCGKMTISEAIVQTNFLNETEMTMRPDA
jgi:hypothetical protein